MCPFELYEQTPWAIDNEGSLLFCIERSVFAPWLTNGEFEETPCAAPPSRFGQFARKGHEGMSVSLVEVSNLPRHATNVFRHK